MSKSEYVIEWPKSIDNNWKGYSFCEKLQANMNNSKSSVIVWDMRNTKSFSTNLVAFLYFIIEKQKEQGKNIVLWLSDKDKHDGEKVIHQIFQNYASGMRSFFKPRMISTDNVRETEDVLLKYLKQLNLKNYNIIKTLISELFANQRLFPRQ